MNNALLRDFAELKQEEKIIKKKVDEMKGQVFDELQAEAVDEVTIDQVGKIYIVPSRSWKYPPSVVKMEEDLKAAKTEAEARGTATYTDNSYVKFSAIKSNQEE